MNWFGGQIWAHVWFNSEKSIFTARSCPSCRSDLVAGPFDQRPGGWNMRQSLPQPYFFSDTISLFHFWHSIFFPICDFYTDGNIQQTFLWHTGYEWSVPFSVDFVLGAICGLALRNSLCRRNWYVLCNINRSIDFQGLYNKKKQSKTTAD